MTFKFKKHDLPEGLVWLSLSYKAAHLQQGAFQICKMGLITLIVGTRITTLCFFYFKESLKKKNTMSYYSIGTLFSLNNEIDSEVSSKPTKYVCNLLIKKGKNKREKKNASNIMRGV